MLSVYFTYHLMLDEIFNYCLLSITLIFHPTARCFLHYVLLILKS
jgi:hypothetical protein